LDTPQIHIECELPEEPCPALMDRAQISTALLALLRNALEALGSQGHIHVRVARNDTERTLQVEVEDSGCGIPAEIRPFIFDPFFSGREAGRGLGFGLSVAWRIITDHGGTIRVDDDAMPGTRIAIFFPLADQPPSEAMNP
jgi:signal transduction histidine kinase